MTLEEFLRAQLYDIKADAEFYLANDADPAGAEWAQLALADVEAKQRILELHHPSEQTIDGKAVCARCVDPDAWNVTRLPDEEVYPCETVRLLALPYANHSSYRQEWRP